MSTRQKQAPATETEDDELDLEIDDEDFPETTSTPGVIEDEVKKAFERDLQEARDLSLQTFSSTDEKNKALMDFVKNRQEGWKGQTEKERRNFLHVLASHNNYMQKPRLQWLMARAILRLPELMGVLDSTKRTPLTVAISLGNEMFVHAACRNVKLDTRKLIGQYLEAECVEHDDDRGITCLHTAILNNFNPELTSIIIDFVPEKMFSVVDFKGRTPLHLAVDFEKCCATQVDIVTELLRRGPAALDVLTRPDRWKRTYSVFQYHEDTRRTAKSRALQQSQNAAKLQELKLLAAEIEPQARETAEAKKITAKPLHGHGQPRSMALATPRSRMDPGTHGVGANRTESSSASPAAGDLERAPRPLVRVATGHLDRQTSSDPGNKSLNSPSAGKRPEPPQEKEKERAESADKIKEMLKLMYLRLKKPHEAAQFLHIQDERGTYELHQQRSRVAVLTSTCSRRKRTVVRLRVGPGRCHHPSRVSQALWPSPIRQSPAIRGLPSRSAETTR
jgi:hypothetical protein